MTEIVGVMGPGEQATVEDVEMAYELGREIAQAGWILLTGGRPVGVMEAASRGAKSAGGLTMGILSGDRREDVSSAVDIPIVTGMGNGRNIINVLSSSVIISCGLGPGTASEVALAIKIRKPVIFLNVSTVDQQFFQNLAGYSLGVASRVGEAIALIHQSLSTNGT
jgi:uncharacterized protein (TIGR00725 family)